VASSRDGQGAGGGVAHLSGHPRWRADFKQLACQGLARARGKLGMERGDFAMMLTGLVGWDVTESHITSWEGGTAPPSDVLLAAASAENGSLIVPPDSLLGRVPPAFAAQDLVGYWVSSYKFTHAGKIHYHADVSYITAESDRHVQGVNHPPEPRTQGRSQGFRNAIEATLCLRHLIGQWRNDSDRRYFGAFQLAVWPGETVMVGYYTGLASDVKVSNSVWKWVRITSEGTSTEDLSEVVLKEPAVIYGLVKKQTQNDPPLTWGDIREAS
jgi:hypothetical protein